MDEKQKIHSLEEDLRNNKSDIRQDFEAVKQKVQQTKNELSPTNLVRERIFLLSAITFAVGFAMGYRHVLVVEFASPATTAAFASAIKQARMNAVKRSR